MPGVELNDHNGSLSWKETAPGSLAEDILFEVSVILNRPCLLYWAEQARSS